MTNQIEITGDRAAALAFLADLAEVMERHGLDTLGFRSEDEDVMVEHDDFEWTAERLHFRSHSDIRQFIEEQGEG